VIAGDLAGAQKRLVEVAARAGDAGQPQNALKLYATLLAKYPQSQYADFVRANMKQEERKLTKG
jgi:outer membrane protein assembly factor BamD (BamD/ComL family)